MNIASIYWTPNKSNPLIWYMLIDQNYQIKIQPSCINVDNIKENLDSIFHEFDNLSSENGYCLKYKSIFKQYKRHRPDSAHFDNEIIHQVNKRKITSDKKQSKIQKDARKLLKRALSKFSIPIEPKESIDLWAISLKVGQKESGVKKVIEKLWKNKNNITRFDKKNKELFSEFFRQLTE